MTVINLRAAMADAATMAETYADANTYRAVMGKRQPATAATFAVSLPDAETGPAGFDAAALRSTIGPAVGRHGYGLRISGPDLSQWAGVDETAYVVYLTIPDSGPWAARGRFAVGAAVRALAGRWSADGLRFAHFETVAVAMAETDLADYS